MKPKEIIGWVGVLLILLAYMLTTFGVIKPQELIYGFLNFFGAIGIITSSYGKRDFQPILLNVVWLIVAAIGIIRSFVG
jgi:paired small multidrug resistance pump